MTAPFHLSQGTQRRAGREVPVTLVDLNGRHVAHIRRTDAGRLRWVCEAIDRVGDVATQDEALTRIAEVLVEAYGPTMAPREAPRRRQAAAPKRKTDGLGHLKDRGPSQEEARKAAARGVCPRCGRALKCTAYQPPSVPKPTATWACSCGFEVTMPKAHQLYRRARLERGDIPKDGDNTKVGRAAIL